PQPLRRLPRGGRPPASPSCWTGPPRRPCFAGRPMSTLGVLVRHRMRRDRIQVPVWLASLTALLLFSALALQDTFGGLEERTLLVHLAAANPAIMFIRGVPQGTDAAAVLIFTVLAFLGVLVALMNTFL